MSDQRCEACYHTPLPCMGGHVGRMAEAPPETGHAAESCGQCECCEAWRATHDEALADVARLTAERDTARLERDSAREQFDRHVEWASQQEREARAQTWAEAVQVVEQVAPIDRGNRDWDAACASVLAALRAKQKEEPK